MSLLTKYSLKKETKKGILKIAQEAEAAAATGAKVINGTIGMLYNEEGELATFKAVKKAEKELTLDSNRHQPARIHPLHLKEVLSHRAGCAPASAAAHGHERT